MKKLLLLLVVVGSLLISGIGSADFSLEKNRIKKIMLSFSQLSVKENSNYITLEIEGANSILIKKDYYVVPTCIETFTFPFGTEIKSIRCIPKNIHRRIITKELMIAPQPVPIDQTSLNRGNQMATNPTAIDTWYEYSIGTGIYGNERNVFVKIQVFPIQYHPSKNTIEWAENVEIEIKYKEPEELQTFNSEYSFIILAPSDYSDELKNLVEHKNNRGIPTKLVTLDEIYNGDYFAVQGRDDAEKIKYFIKNAIEEWGTSFVLLVGGSETFPVRKVNTVYTFVSDLYYADIYNGTGSFCSWDFNGNNKFGEYNKDGVDLYPDVYLGRLACVNESEVTTCVNKIINYEANKAYEQEWFTCLVVCGGDTLAPPLYSHSKMDEGEIVNQAIIDIMTGFSPNKIWASNGRLSGDDPSGVEEINNALNAGCGFVDFSGEGNTFGWATHPHNDSDTWLPTPSPGGYFKSNVPNLTNGDKLPIIVIGACKTHEFDEDSDCFGWAFLKNPNGGGIASFGTTTYAVDDYDMAPNTLTSKFEVSMFKAYKQEGAITIGEMWSKAIAIYIYPEMDRWDFLTLEEWQPFGDPSLAIAEQSQPPEKPETPQGPKLGKVNKEYIYTTSTTDPDGDKIYYMFDWGDGTYSGWIGPYASGDTAEVGHKWSKWGSYEIRAKAKDEHGMQSEWSDPLPMIMPKIFSFDIWHILEIINEWFEQIIGRNILPRLYL
ncbi:MAG TPA: hypothetical protein ENI33_07845 [Thermoplasmatales archaeon]|nr:hypothetical protein [Thermoplasmatales archaeon]